MLFFHRLFAVAFVSIACASKLSIRQATNTNAAIKTIVDRLDETMRRVGPAILMLQAENSASSNTVGPQFTTMEMAFTNATNQLKATAVSSGSNTTSPTNDEIGITYSDALQLVSTSLSGLQAQGSVASFATLVATFDPILSNNAAQLNITSPGSLALVHIMMLDASQFLRDEGFTRTLTTLGF
ncbi:POXA3b laccase small subunit [Mycena crocata]|nr:POXA3b laccase small subunit [Mycena crocata]